MNGLRIAASAVVVTFMGCAPLPGTHSAATAPVVSDVASGAIAPPIVQVRDYWRSSTISIVAWDEDAAEFGLRTAITRTGTLVSDQRFGDHRLYLNPYLSGDFGGFKYASVAKGELLLRTATQRDTFACFYGRSCSPMVAEGVRIPDSLLRANRDSLVVTFYPSVQEPWSITLRRELIDAYLQKVDSVAAVMRRGVH
jgi:hypothetical protein